MVHQQSQSCLDSTTLSKEAPIYQTQSESGQFCLYPLLAVLYRRNEGIYLYFRIVAPRMENWAAMVYFPTIHQDFHHLIDKLPPKSTIHTCALSCYSNIIPIVLVFSNTKQISHIDTCCSKGSMNNMKADIGSLTFDAAYSEGPCSTVFSQCIWIYHCSLSSCLHEIFNFTTFPITISRQALSTGAVP